MGGLVGMTLPLKHRDELENLALMAPFGSKGLVGDSFSENVAARLRVW